MDRFAAPLTVQILVFDSSRAAGPSLWHSGPNCPSGRLKNEENARRLHTRLARLSKWRQRFGRDRLAGLEDARRTSKPKTYGQQAEQRILALLDSDPPEGYSQCNGRLLAKHLEVATARCRLGIIHAGGSGSFWTS